MTGTGYCHPKIGIRALVAAALTAFLAVLFIAPAITPEAIAGTTRSGQFATDTARIQSLLDNPVNGTVNLPAGTFTVRPVLRLHQGETIIGHHTTLKVAAHSGNYYAMLADTAGEDLSGLTITGVTFDQNTAANPITSTWALYHGYPRFVLLVTRGSNVTIRNNQFTHTNNVNTLVTGSATSNVTISGNVFTGINRPVHDHSTIYTSGTGTIISHNTFTGTVMAHSAAIEVHGKKADIFRNTIQGYYRGINIVCSQATVTHNTVIGTVNPVDLWSVVAPGLTDVRVTDNTLNRNLSYWTRVLGAVPPAQYTQQVIRDATSTFYFRHITIHRNRA